MSDHPFLDFCEQAACSPDTTMTDAEMAARWTKRTGVTMAARTVKKMRDHFWQQIHAAPGVHVGTWKL